MRKDEVWKRLLKIGQGPRPDLLEEGKEEGGMVKGLRQVRKEARAAGKEESPKGAYSDKAERDENVPSSLDCEATDKMALILALLWVVLPIALAGLAVATLLIWILCRFWLHV